MAPPTKFTVIRARCDAGLKRRVDQFCEATGLSEADIVRLAVNDYLARARNPEAAGISMPINLSSTAPSSDTTAKADSMVSDIARKIRKSSRAK